ncbi:DRTGG domain-containing protein [Maribellus mangrovi]|uniref:DRTGG domain-containing protein n=1 Tax=Maribellus mangrovi TaxID=3133146 RepID=UPI0030EF4FF7
MKLADIIRITEAKLIVGNEVHKHDLKRAFSSDLMSDVLTLETDNILLITGLTNPQLIRTAEMADIEVVLLARNKKASPEMIELAREVGLVLLETPYSIYRASGVLFTNGLEAVY